MRDSDILAMRDKESRQLSVIYRQVIFMQTRLEAYEAIISKPWIVLHGMFSPKWLKEQVDAAQLKLLHEHDEMVRMNKEKLTAEASKPKLTIVGAN